MVAKGKTIKMLLYNGELNGVMYITDSAWIGGEMYSASRESIADLISTCRVKKYGVYILLSDQLVYIGQASDLEQRTKQHLCDKDWWTRVILMTTEHDTLNASDIDYLESRLIDLANKAGKLDSDNKKKGNPQKVDPFQKNVLEQYLEEAMFLLELIGVQVFSGNEKKAGKPKKQLQSKKGKTVPIETPGMQKIADLPDASLKIGQFVYAAMEKLEAAGYVFSESDIDAMCTSNWSKEHFHTKKAFMKRYIEGETDNKGPDGYVRFKSKPYQFGNEKVLISKEWYEHQRGLFTAWYTSLRQ